MNEGTLVRDVSGKDKDTYYLVFNKNKKIYKIHKGVELDLVKVLIVTRRWYENEFEQHLKMGYVLIDDLKDL